MLHDRAAEFSSRITDSITLVNLASASTSWLRCCTYTGGFDDECQDILKLHNLETNKNQRTTDDLQERALMEPQEWIYLLSAARALLQHHDVPPTLYETVWRSLHRVLSPHDVPYAGPRCHEETWEPEQEVFAVRTSVRVRGCKNIFQSPSFTDCFIIVGVLSHVRCFVFKILKFKTMIDIVTRLLAPTAKCFINVINVSTLRILK
ncbi:unnamed protein product [Trichogramma brassicae]|uniref:Uncharacterized protein n=1 Tax=Trichogramma brassicae TaxID=86971 RepID=A0A6H5IDL9_9HYME|nr:unnamed protein product [Trichogramma brassicae]